MVPTVRLLRHWLTNRPESERRVIARCWSLPIELAGAPEALAELMLHPEILTRIVGTLGPRERAALEFVQAYGGAIPVLIMERLFGPVRVPETYPNPYSYLLALAEPSAPTERLYLLALLQRIDQGRERHYMIPPDLLAQLPPIALRAVTLQLDARHEPTTIQLGDNGLFERYLLDLLVLAYAGQLEVIAQGSLNKTSLVRLARRREPQATLNGVTREEQWPFARFLRSVAVGANLVRVGADGLLRPTREALEWMQLPAGERLRRLVAGWVAADWDELTALCGLRIPTSFRRDIRHGKQILQRFVGQLPAEIWFSFDDLRSAIQQADPDFLRPDGNYESWSITDRSGRPLNGFPHWSAVEGELITAVVGESLRWLGIVDIGLSHERPDSFRLTGRGRAVLQDQVLPPEPAAELLVLQPNFEVVVPADCSLYGRFQISRIAEQISTEETALFRLTRRSVHAAFGRGIGAAELVAFLEEQTGRELPQNVAVTLREWSAEYGRVRLRRVALLEADDPTTLERIRRDKRVRLPAVEQIGVHAWAVPEGEVPALAERVRQAGYGLAGDIQEPPAALTERDLATVLTALEFYAEASDVLGLENDVSASLRRRVVRLLPERVANRSYRVSHESVAQLRAQLEALRRK